MEGQNEKDEKRSGFQHLFTSVSKEALKSGGSGNECRLGGKANLNRFKLTDDDPPENLHMESALESEGLSDVEDYENSGSRNRLENFFRPRRETMEFDDETEDRQNKAEEIVDDVHSLAMSFCAGNRSLEEMREEWFREGGIKDVARLDFKRRRKQALKNKGIS